MPSLSLIFISAEKTISSSQYNGFIIKSPLIPLGQICHVGPARDGIPSIDKPRFIAVHQQTYLRDSDRVLGLEGTEDNAYPVRILNSHEIINDGDTLISYCPLCGTSIAFKSVDSDFGVSGLLYNSDMLLYDRETHSLWSQILGQAIRGKRKGQYLRMLPLQHTSWAN